MRVFRDRLPASFNSSAKLPEHLSARSDHVQNLSIMTGVRLHRPAGRERLSPASENYACVGWSMRQQDVGFDYHRYRQLLAEATDEESRLALIELLIEERAKDRLAAQRNSDRAAMTAATVARVLGRPRG